MSSLNYLKDKIRILLFWIVISILITFFGMSKTLAYYQKTSNANGRIQTASFGDLTLSLDKTIYGTFDQDPVVYLTVTNPNTYFVDYTISFSDSNLTYLIDSSSPESFEGTVMNEASNEHEIEIYGNIGSTVTITLTTTSPYGKQFTQVINFDTAPPAATVTSTSNIATSQTVTLAMSDNNALSKYYFGLNDSPSAGNYVSLSGTSSTKTVTVNAAGEYYLKIYDASGNIYETTVVFNRVDFSIPNTNVTVTPAYVIVKDESTIVLPNPTSVGYTLDTKWYTDDTYIVAAGNYGANYTVSDSITLYSHGTPREYNLYYSGAGSTGLNTGDLIVNYDALYHNGNTLLDLGNREITATANNVTFGTDYMQFNGTSSWVNMGLMSSDYMTLEAMFSVDEAPTGIGYIVANVQTGGGGIAVGPSNSIFGGFYINGSYRWLEIENIIEVGKKYHIAVTYNGAVEKLYLNGIEIASQTYSGYTIQGPSNDTVMALGTNPTGSGPDVEFFKGKIYSAAVYKGALSAGQIAKDAGKILTYNSTYGTLPTPERQGYVFDGWYTAPTGGTEVTSSTLFTGTADVTLYAHWLTAYRILYSGMGGTTISDSTVLGKYDALYHDNNILYDMGPSATTGITNNVTYGTDYMQFNGSNSYASLGKKHSNYMSIEILVSVDELGTGTGTGTIIGSTEAGGIALEYLNSTHFQGQFHYDGAYHSSIIYPGLEANRKYHVALVFDGNNMSVYIDGLLRNIDAVSNKVLTEPINNTVMMLGANPTGSSPQGNYFKGKIYSAAIFNTALSAEQIALDARKFVAPGKAYGTLPTPEREGYVFAGWYTAPTGGTEITSSTIFNGSSETTIYAHWIKKPKVNYFLSDNLMTGIDGYTAAQTSNSRVQYSYNNGAITIKALVDDGYLQYTTGRVAMTAGKKYFFSSDLDSTWGDLTQDTVDAYFMLNGQTTTYYGIYPRPQRFPFTGTVSPTVTGTYYLRLDVNQSGKTHTFSNIKMYEYHMSKYVATGSTYGEVPDPEREGYVFDGWYTAPTGGTEVTSSTVLNGTTDVNLYAHWTPVYAIRYDSRGGFGTMADQIVPIGATVNLSQNMFYKNNNKFLEWMKPGTPLYTTGTTTYTPSNDLANGSNQIVVVQLQNIQSYITANGIGPDTIYHIEFDLKSTNTTNSNQIRLFLTNSNAYYARYDFNPITSLPSGTTSSNNGNILIFTVSSSSWLHVDMYFYLTVHNASAPEEAYIIFHGQGTYSSNPNTPNVKNLHFSVAEHYNDQQSVTNLGSAGDIVKMSARWEEVTSPVLTLSKETYLEGYSGWSIPSGGSVSDGVLSLTAASNAISGYYNVGTAPWYITYDGYTTTAASSPGTATGSAGAGTGGTNITSSYYNSSYSSTNSQNGGSSNDFTGQLPLNTWSNNFTYDGNAGYGGSMKYVRFTAKTGNNYSSATSKYRNFRVHGQLYSNFYLINVDASADTSVTSLKYASGVQNPSYFASHGENVVNNQITVTSNGMYTVYAKDEDNNEVIQVIEIDKIDSTAPTITLGSNGDSVQTLSKSVTVTVADNQSGLKAGASIKYGWSTSNTVAPNSWTNATLSYTEGMASTTFTATASNMTGAYYLWVVPITLKDVADNTRTGNVISTGTFQMVATDVTPPNITCTVNSSGTSGVNVTISANDPDSGLSSNPSGTFTITSTTTYTATNKAGLSKSCTVTVSRYTRYTKKRYPCTKGTWNGGSVSYVNSCTAISQATANANNTNTYVTCSGIYSSSCPSGNTTMCQKKTTYSRTGCSTYSSSYDWSNSGLTSCEPSSNKNNKFTCSSYYMYSGSV